MDKRYIVELEISGRVKHSEECTIVTLRETIIRYQNAGSAQFEPWTVYYRVIKMSNSKNNPELSRIMRNLKKT